MSPSLTPDDARRAVALVLGTIVPDVDALELPEDAVLREELELDSLDFLTFVERLGQRTHVRIDEADYPRLATLSSAAALVVERSAQPA